MGLKMKQFYKTLIIILSILVLAVLVVADNGVFDDTDYNGYNIYNVTNITATTANFYDFYTTTTQGAKGVESVEVDEGGGDFSGGIYVYGVNGAAGISLLGVSTSIFTSSIQALAFYTNDWSNVSISTSQITDYTEFSGTVNRSQVVNNWAFCPEGSAQYGENETGRYCDATFLNSSDISGFYDSGDAATFVSVNTGQGAYELYAMNQDVESTDTVTFATVNTGQGANELYDMNQNVQTSDSPTFQGVTFGTSDANHFLYFYEDSSATGEYIEWDDGSDFFRVSDALFTAGDIIDSGYLQVASDIYTTGSGDDLWLGSSTQSTALFQANATGNVKFKNATGVECIIFDSGGMICSGS